MSPAILAMCKLDLHLTGRLLPSEKLSRHVLNLDVKHAECRGSAFMASEQFYSLFICSINSQRLAGTMDNFSLSILYQAWPV